MGGCSAVNCTNHSRKKHRMFAFPKEPDRRKLWAIRCRRKDWVPGRNAQLCSEHFEENQFEQKRQDGWKKLKQTAVPTIFKFPDSSSVPIKPRIKENELQEPDFILESCLNVSKKEDNQRSEIELTRNIMSLKKVTESLRDTVREKELLLKIALLERENESLRHAVREKDKILSFLSEGQISALQVEKHNIAHWDHESFIKALKMRLNLGKRGYNYLRQTGYPLPAWSTMNRRVRRMKLDKLKDSGEKNINVDDIHERDILEYVDINVDYEDDVDDDDVNDES